MKIYQPINRNALIIAMISFMIGTILLLIFMTSQSGVVLKIGIAYVMMALTLNTITFISLITNSLINHQYYRENLISIFIFLLNIPITIAYIIIVDINPLKNTLI